MIHDLIERFNYRYRLWLAERLGDKVGAGVPAVPSSPKNEPLSRMVLRHVWTLLAGIIILTGIGRIAMQVVPTARFGIAVAAIVLASIWFIVGLTTLASEWITKRNDSDGDHKSSNQTMQRTAGRRGP